MVTFSVSQGNCPSLLSHQTICVVKGALKRKSLNVEECGHWQRISLVPKITWHAGDHYQPMNLQISLYHVLSFGIWCLKIDPLLYYGLQAKSSVYRHSLICHVYGMYMSCICHVYVMYMSCICHVYGMYMYMSCIWHVYGMYMYMSCIWHVYGMYMADTYNNY